MYSLLLALLLGSCCLVYHRNMCVLFVTQYIFVNIATAVIQARLMRHREVLLSSLECQYGLLDELYSRCVFSYQQFQLIKRKKDISKQNSALLQVIGDMDMQDINKFISALHSTCQSHLVAYIINNGRMFCRIIIHTSTLFGFILLSIQNKLKINVIGSLQNKIINIINIFIFIMGSFYLHAN